MRHPSRFLRILLCCLLVTVVVAESQLGRRGRRSSLVIMPAFDSNPEVDQRKFTFVRIKFTMKDIRFNQGGEVPWAHDIPFAERNLIRILQEFTGIESNEDGIVLMLDDPELFKYPFAYMCEVGFMDPTERELLGLREYIKRGGFIIVDDFGDNFWWSDDWSNFEFVIKRTFPDKQLRKVDITHPIFHSFFDMQTIDFPNYRGMGKYFILEDEAGRVSMIVNFNNDIGDYWEYANNGYLPVALTNEAFKLGVNYIIYALSH